MTSAISAFGALLNWDTVDLAELTNISGPSQSMDPIEVTSHDSADQFKEFIAGLHDGGEITLEGNFIVGDTTGQIAMHTDFQATTVKTWILKWPGWASGPQFTGSGYITAFTWDFPHEGKVSFSVTIKITGKPVFTAS